MKILIQLSTSKPDDGLESLHTWLAGEPGIALSVDRVTVPPHAGELGSLTDALMVAVGSGGSLTVLISSIRAWITLPRHSRLTVRIRSEEQPEQVIEIDSDGIQSSDIAQIFQNLYAQGSAS